FRSSAELLQVFQLLRESGYNGVELNATDPLGIDLAELERLVTAAGLVIPSFLTGEAYNDGLCLSSPDAGIREKTVQRLIGYLDLASRFGACLVVGLLQGLRRDEPDPIIAHRRIIDGLRLVAEEALEKSVDVVIEPVNHLQVGFHNSVAEVLS